MRTTRLILVAACAVAMVGQAAHAGVTAYSSFDSSLTPDVALDANFATCCGSPSIASGGALGSAGSVDVSAGGFNIGGLGGQPWQNEPTIASEGTLQFWVSPNWDGKDNGGPGVGGSGDRQNLFMQSSGVFSNTGVNIAIFNNNYPNDGGQIFGNVQDHDSGNVFEAYDVYGGITQNGSTRTWASGQWYHIALTWSEDYWSVWANGALAGQKVPDGAITWGADAWIGQGDGGQNKFDGRIDELSIHDSVLFDESQQTYTVPTQVVPEPASAALLLAGGLMLGLRRRK